MAARPDSTPRRGLPLPLATVALVVYAAVVVAASMRHEAWYDEAEPWLLARDGTLADVFRTTPHAGTPALWFLALMVPAKLGFAIQGMAWVNAAFAIAAIAVLLWRSPLPRLVTIGFAFGFYAVYEFGVIARPYALMMMLMFGAAARYASRIQRPLGYAVLVALLANATAHAVAIAGALVALYGYEIWRARTRSTAQRAALILMAGGVLAAAWQLRPQPDAQLGGLAVLRDRYAYRMVGASLFYFAPWFGGILSKASYVLAPLTLVGGVVALIDRPKALAFLLISLAWLVYVFHFKWYQMPRHSGLVLLLLLTALWLGSTEPGAFTPGGPRQGLGRVAETARHATGGLLTIALGLSIPVAFHWVRKDWSGPFSESREMADWIRANTRPEELMVADMFGSTVLAHLPRDRRMWLAARRDFGSFHTWTQTAIDQNVRTWDSVQIVTDRAAEAFPRPRPLLVLVINQLPPSIRGYELIHVSPDRRMGYYNEPARWFLYRRTP
ncbi:MAG TPA: hypothetical protein VI172_00035 [Candidatus Dormibacteraeota bacterium]|jgi:hypothetical protein